MSPILVRPVREQLEHDRVIRLLQQDLQKKKVEVGINPGYEQNAGVGSGTRKEYPDAVVYSLEKGRRLVAVVEVETGESVNDLEAKAQWAHLAKLRVPFHLYVPMGSVDVARRLAADNQISVSEIWSYHQVGEQFKFTLIHPPGSGKGRAAQAPRTVSVSPIRVAVPDPDAGTAVVDEPAPAPPPAPVAQKAPRVVPVKAPVGKAKAVGAAKVPVAAKVAPKAVAKAAPVKPAPTKPAPTKPAPKPAPPRPIEKAAAPKPAEKSAAKPVVKAKPVAKPAPKPPARPVAKAKSVAKVAPKAPVKPAKASRPAARAAGRKPAGKRK